MGNGTYSVMIRTEADAVSRRRELSATVRHARKLLDMGFDIRLAVGPASLPDQSCETESSQAPSDGSDGVSNTNASPPSETQDAPSGQHGRRFKHRATES